MSDSYSFKVVSTADVIWHSVRHDEMIMNGDYIGMWEEAHTILINVRTELSGLAMI